MKHFIDGKLCKELIKADISYEMILKWDAMVRSDHEIQVSSLNDMAKLLIKLNKSYKKLGWEHS